MWEANLTIIAACGRPSPLLILNLSLNDFCRERGYLQDEARVHGRTGQQRCVTDHPGLAAAEIFAAAPKFHRRFYFRPSYRGRTALMLRGSGE